MIEKLKAALRPYKWLHHSLKNRQVNVDELIWGRLFFAQFGEDVLLESIFGREKTDGYYVDVGAFNPIISSNTHAFYRKGWRGINIEPNPDLFTAFPQKRPDDINLNLAISDRNTVVKFSCDAEYSGIRDEDYLFADRNKEARIIEVETIPLRQVLDAHLPAGQSIDFMNVDCEGHDFKVLRSNDWSKYRPTVVAVEQHGPTIAGKVHDLLTENGYCFYCKIGLTLLFILREESGKHLP